MQSMFIPTCESPITIILNILFGRSCSPRAPVSGGAIDSVILSTKKNRFYI